MQLLDYAILILKLKNFKRKCILKYLSNKLKQNYFVKEIEKTKLSFLALFFFDWDLVFE
jgi:hypothetical protein